MVSEKINWRVYERDHIYPQGVAAYLDLIRLKPAKRFCYLAKHYEVVTFADDYFWWARDADLLKRSFKRWFEGWLKDKKKRNEIISLYEKSHARLERELPKLYKEKIDKKSNGKLFVIYQSARKIFLNNILFSEYTTDLFDDFFGKIFREKLLRLNENFSTGDFSPIMRPAYVSANSQYRKALLELSFLKNIPDKTCEKIREKYSWIVMSWNGGNELTLNQVKKDLAEVKKDYVSGRQAELKKIKGFCDSVITKRRGILRKYGISFFETRKYFHLLDIFAKFHDWRKETQMRCNQVIFLALREISRRFKIDYRQLLFYYNEEIRDLCLNRQPVNLKKIKQRQIGITFVIEHGAIKEVIGQRAKTTLNRLVISALKAKKQSQVTGISANRGKVKGRAYVVKGYKEASKIMKPGGILIASMTSIDYAPAMKKAAAIVTDDGGITCHAAIVSRELDIPCVVGTKFATQIFKTGDLVEVDANKGVVKRIK